MRKIARLATTVAAAGAVAVTGLTLGAGAAQADTWCPGQGLPFPMIRWDMNMCHTWYTVPSGQGNVKMVALNGDPIDSWILADAGPPVFAPPPPPSGPPPGTPFCSPRGAFIIIPPICDEIGVDWPPGSLNH